MGYDSKKEVGCRGEPVATKYGRFSRISLNAAGEGVRSERCGKLALQGCNNMT